MKALEKNGLSMAVLVGAEHVLPMGTNQRRSFTHKVTLIMALHGDPPSSNIQQIADITENPWCKKF